MTTFLATFRRKKDEESAVIFWVMLVEFVLQRAVRSLFISFQKGESVIQLRREQPSLWHKGLAKDIEDLWEPWMKEADRLLEDAALLESVYEAQGKRHAQSRTRGRLQTPAEVALRLLILKHVRNWGYDTLEREVRANLVYRPFTRIESKAGGLKQKIRDRLRTVQKRVLAIALAARQTGPQREERQREQYAAGSDAKDSESGQGSVGGSRATAASASALRTAVHRAIANDGRAVATGGAADQGTRL
jgi:hypothetical protein